MCTYTRINWPYTPFGKSTMLGQIILYNNILAASALTDKHDKLQGKIFSLSKITNETKKSHILMNSLTF